QMFVSFFRIISEAVPCDNQKRLRTLASYQRPFRMNVSWRSEKVTQDKAPGTPRPSFKATPLYDEVQILPDLREQVLLECLVHWFKEQVPCQHTSKGIGAGEHDTLRVEDIDKIGEGDTQEYPCALKGCFGSFITVSRSFYDLKG